MSCDVPLFYGLYCFTIVCLNIWRAKEKYGSLENLENEKQKARRQEELYLRGKAAAQLSSETPLEVDANQLGYFPSCYQHELYQAP